MLAVHSCSTLLSVLALTRYLTAHSVAMDAPTKPTGPYTRAEEWIDADAAWQQSLCDTGGKQPRLDDPPPSMFHGNLEEHTTAVSGRKRVCFREGHPQDRARLLEPDDYNESDKTCKICKGAATKKGKDRNAQTGGPVRDRRGVVCRARGGHVLQTPRNDGGVLPHPQRDTVREHRSSTNTPRSCTPNERKSTRNRFASIGTGTPRTTANGNSMWRTMRRRRDARNCARR